MSTFAYTALEPSGRKKTGFIDAPDQAAAMALVASEGRYVLEIREHEVRQGEGESRGGAARKGRTNRSDLALFTRRLADLSAAGLPLDRVLQVIGEQSESAQLAAVATAALKDVRTGVPVSAALEKFPKLFPEVYTQTLRAGEASGQFSESAERLAQLQENEATRRSQIASALIYPAALAATAVLVVVFLLTFVVPKLSGVFKDLGGSLPLPTKILLAVTGFLTQQGLLILLGIGVAIAGYRAYVATPAGALARDKVALNMPLLGKTIRKGVVSRYARVLGTLVFGGVPILEALHISALASGNRVYTDRSILVEQEVREGRPIAVAMRDAGVFPPVLTHMVAIGEETGDLPKMLGRVADSMDFEVDQGLRRFTAMVEPIIVLTMGAIVAVIMLSVLLPIYEAQSLVK